MALTQTTAAQILDGSIKDADIASDAAIAQSKISNLATDLGNKSDKLVTVTTKSNNFTLALVDAGCFIDCMGTSPMNCTVPNNSTVAFPIGTAIIIAQESTGTVTINPASGVSIMSQNGYRISGASGVATLIKIATNSWWLTGALMV